MTAERIIERLAYDYADSSSSMTGLKSIPVSRTPSG
jgi:hypothetical protein